MFLWISVLLVLTVCAEARDCGMEDYTTLLACFSAWGYTIDVVVQPDQTLWDMDVFAEYCRSEDSGTFSSCVGRVISSCQISQFPEQEVIFTRTATMTDMAIGSMCSKIDVIEVNRGCLDAADREMTQCAIDSENISQAEIMEQTMDGDELTFDQIKTLNGREAYEIMGCVDEVLKRTCNQEVAALFNEFYYAAYVAWTDE